MPKKPSSSDDATCGHCERHEKTMFSCSRCGLVKYCSKPCQKAAWGEHKPLCIPKADRVPQPSPPLSDDGRPAGVTAVPDGGACCSICLEPLTLGSAQTLPCGHAFHGPCVEGLRKFGLAKAQVCPMCREALPPGPDQLWEEAFRHYGVISIKVKRGAASWGALTKADQREVDEAVRLTRQAAEQGHI